MPVLRKRLLTLLAVAMCSGASHAESPGPTSEEYPPVACDPGAFISAVTCTGRYCDNIKIECARLPGVALGKGVWTKFVSAEAGEAKCPDKHLIAGLACNGRYCDNVSLQCVEVTNARMNNCHYSAKVSEEQGMLYFGQGIIDKAGQHIAARAIRCSGRYCDNLEFDVCEVGVNATP